MTEPTHVTGAAYKPPAMPADEADRIGELKQLRLLDTPANINFDAITQAASRTFDVPICLVSVVDSNRQWFKSGCGLDAAETARDISFCGHTILEADGFMVVKDAKRDPRFKENPLVTGAPFIRFYAGATVRGPGGHALGTLCLIDNKPREFSEADAELLTKMARWVEMEIVLHAADASGVQDIVGGIAGMDATLILNRGKFWNIGQDMLAIAGTDGYFKDLNVRFTQLLGYSREELLARPFTDFVHPDDVQATGDEVARLAEGMPSVSFRNRYRANDSTYRWLEWNATPVGEFLYASARDVTAIVYQERALLESKKDLEAKNQALEEFTSVASHDLQEPLRKIIGFADQLQSRASDELDERSVLYLERIVAASRRMQDFIRALLTMSRVTSAGLRMERIDPNRLMEEVLEELRPLILESKGEVMVPDLPNIRADLVQTRQLFTNLISNSLKYRREEESPRIWISGKEKDGRIMFEVRDNGIGFDPQYATQIFKPFERLHGTSEYPGNGMGLAICQRIVHRHDGTITASSGTGATFWFDLEASRV